MIIVKLKCHIDYCLNWNPVMASIGEKVDIYGNWYIFSLSFKSIDYLKIENVKLSIFDCKTSVM